MMAKTMNYLCDICGEHWEGDAKCIKCGEVIDIRRTMSREEAERLGLINND